MHVLHVVLLAGALGLADAMGVSRSAHAEAIRIWLDLPDGVAGSLAGMMLLGSALGIATAIHGRLRAALAEGVRGIARPSLFRTSPPAIDGVAIGVMTAASLATEALLRPYVELWDRAPVAIGIGLVGTGAMIASSDLAGASRENVTWPRALVAGAAQGVGGLLPGSSGLAAALAALLWLGMKAPRAVELAFAAGVVALLIRFARAMLGPAGSVDVGSAILGVTVAFIAAAIGARALRKLVGRRRASVLALWAVPLGLALVAYGRAMPLVGAESTTPAQREIALPAMLRTR